MRMRTANCELGMEPLHARDKNNGLFTAEFAEDAEELILCALCDLCGEGRCRIRAVLSFRSAASASQAFPRCSSLAVRSSQLAVRSSQFAARSCFSGRPIRRPVVIELQLRLGLERDEKAEREVP